MADDFHSNFLKHGYCFKSFLNELLSLNIVFFQDHLSMIFAFNFIDQTIHDIKALQPVHVGSAFLYCRVPGVFIHHSTAER